jgi:hypothetical protein
VWESSSGRFRVQLSRTADKPEKSVSLLSQSAACFSFKGIVGLLLTVEKRVASVLTGGRRRQS